MGGGAAMRAAAKAAGIGVAKGGLRGVSAEHPVAAASARKATRSVSSAAVSSPEEVSLSLAASQSNPIDAAVQRPCWELDDWEFAGVEEDTVLNSGEPLPRLVFGRAPTPEEAKEATSELKDALDKIYLSSPHSTEFKEAGHESALPLIPNPENLENKACIISEASTKSVPTNALKAFRLLNENPAAQTVVASIASDPNVWHAVLQNEALSEYLQSQKTTAPFSDTEPVTKEFIADTSPVRHFSRSFDESSGFVKSSGSGNGFMDFVEGMKSTVLEMMNGLSEYFQNIFGGGPSPGKADAGTDAMTFTEKAIGASLMGLAVMVIMVIVMKRP